MKAPGALFLVLWALAAPARGGGDLALPDNPLAGRLLFESRGCARCHGIAGSGPGIGPDLGGGRFAGSFLDLGAALWNHAPGMSVSFQAAGLPWPELAPGEAIELLTFLYFIDYLGRPGVAAAGQRTFTIKGCASCHEIGAPGASVGPDLAALRRFASPLFIAQAIWNHGPSMLESMGARGISPPTFREGDLADLSAFIRQRAAPGPRERVLLAPGNPNEGRQLFAAKGCAECHGEGARGGRGGPDLGGADLHRSAEAIAGAMWNHALAMRAEMRARGIGWPTLTTEELSDLVAFLYFLPFTDLAGDAEGGAGVFQRSCAACHGAGGGRPAPDLGASEALASPGALVAAMWNHAPIMKETVLAEGHPWPELSGEDLRDLFAFLRREAGSP